MKNPIGLNSVIQVGDLKGFINGPYSSDMMIVAEHLNYLHRQNSSAMTAAGLACAGIGALAVIIFLQKKRIDELEDTFVSKGFADEEIDID